MYARDHHAKQHILFGIVEHQNGFGLAEGLAEHISPARRERQ